MSYHVIGLLDEKVWLFHRHIWSKIKNPLIRKEYPLNTAYPESETIHDILQEYAYTYWHLGPTSLLPHYSGMLVYSYVYVGERKAPTYLIWIDTVHLGAIVYAQELPDLLEVLDLLGHLVLVGIFEHAYVKSQRRFRRY